MATVETAEPTVRGVVVDATPRDLAFQRRTMLVMTVVPLAGFVAAVWMLWGSGITTTDFGIFLGFYIATGLGITVGYHRLFTHKSFEAVTPVRWTLAVFGSMAIQGSVVDWVATHRRHHAYSDEPGDPHSPHLDAEGGWRGILRGLYHAHLGWLFKPAGTVAETWAPDLLRDPVVSRVSKAFPFWVAVSFVLPAVLGGLITMSWGGMLTAFLWGSLARIFLLHHVTWSINSICHFYGTQPFESHDEARNNMPMALLGFGEGWHNAHHAFPASARHGLRWWEVDFSWYTIQSLKVARLVSNVKVPSPAQIARKLRR